MHVYCVLFVWTRNFRSTLSILSIALLKSFWWLLVPCGSIISSCLSRLYVSSGDSPNIFIGSPLSRSLLNTSPSSKLGACSWGEVCNGLVWVIMFSEGYVTWRGQDFKATRRADGECMGTEKLVRKQKSWNKIPLTWGRITYIFLYNPCLVTFLSLLS